MPIRFKPLPPQETLLEWFYVDEVGALRWRRVPKQSKISAGAVAGVLVGRSGWFIKFQGEHYYAQRIVWKMMKGHDPQKQIDHMDRNQSNNRIDNLRLVTHSQNHMNIPRSHTNNKLGLRNIQLDVVGNYRKYRVMLHAKGVRVFDATFKTVEEAIAARDAAVGKYYGEYGRRD